MAEKLCQLKKKGGSDEIALPEPSSNILVCHTITGLINNAGNDYTDSSTGTDCKAVYASGTFTVTSITAGTFVIVGWLNGSKGITVEEKTVGANETICQGRYASGSYDQTGKWTVFFVYKKA